MSYIYNVRSVRNTIFLHVRNHCPWVRSARSALLRTQIDPRSVTFFNIHPVLQWPGSHWPGPFCAQLSHWSAHEKHRPASHPKPGMHSAQPSTPAPVHRLQAVAHASQLRSGVKPKPSLHASQPKSKSHTSQPSTLHLEHSAAPVTGSKLQGVRQRGHLKWINK